MTLCFLERAGCAGGGKGILCSEEKTFTLSTVDNMRICMQEVWSVDPIASNSMKSNNPNSGFHKSKVIKTLDTSVPDPSKNQGGHIIMEEIRSITQHDVGGPLDASYYKGHGFRAGQEREYVAQVDEVKTIVRRLTPIECERLQGFLDGYTNIPWANKPTAPDSRRYKALGNSMAVPVMKFIGNRIESAQPVVYNPEAIQRILTVTPLSKIEKDNGQQTLF